MKEKWKPINNYHGLYEISSIGRVKSLPRMVNNSSHSKRLVQERIIKTANMNGYRSVCLHRNRKQEGARVHSLVLVAFRGNRPKGFDASHINGNRSDNRIENLIWESKKDNIARKVEHGTSNRGDKCGQAKLTNSQARKIRRLRFEENIQLKDLSLVFRVSISSISNVINYKTFKYV